MVISNTTSSHGYFYFENKEIVYLPEETTNQRIASITISFWMFLITVFGSIGNGLIVFVFARDAHLRKKYLLLIVISILYAFGSIFFILNSYHTYFNKIMRDPICTIHAYAISTLSVGGIHQLTVLSLERYIAINHPFLSMKLSLRTKILTALGAFVWTLFTTTPPLLGWSKYKVLDDSLHYCIFDYLSNEKSTRQYMMYLFFNGYIAPLSIIIFSNYKIFSTAKGMIKTRKIDVYRKFLYYQDSNSFYNNARTTNLVKMDKSYKNNSIQEKELYQSYVTYNKQQRKCARVIFYCVGSFVISWTPYAFASIVSNMIFNTQMNATFVMFTAIASKMFVIWNPIIYGLMDQTFRSECRKLFSKCFISQ
uniref:Melanopsin (inferred by orthology to a human protein) n=1 Tax=Strongyloides venezuelensis TaxID=75913 RepID=A0A0K0F9Z0_STRVS